MDTPNSRLKVLFDKPTAIAPYTHTSNAYSDGSPDDGGDQSIPMCGNTVGFAGNTPSTITSTSIFIAFGDGISTPGLSMTGTYSFFSLLKIPFTFLWEDVTYDEHGTELSRIPTSYTMTDGFDSGPGTAVTAAANRSRTMENLRAAVVWLP